LGRRSFREGERFGRFLRFEMFERFGRFKRFNMFNAFKRLGIFGCRFWCFLFIKVYTQTPFTFGGRVGDGG
jgi:hypothetical protein